MIVDTIKNKVREGEDKRGKPIYLSSDLTL
jgi:hypothetical protein